MVMIIILILMLWVVRIILNTVRGKRRKSSGAIMKSAIIRVIMRCGVTMSHQAVSVSVSMSIRGGKGRSRSRRRFISGMIMT